MTLVHNYTSPYKCCMTVERQGVRNRHKGKMYGEETVYAFAYKSRMPHAVQCNPSNSDP